jgi:hypothetical protein
MYLFQLNVLLLHLLFTFINFLASAGGKELTMAKKTFQRSNFFKFY